MLLAGGAFSGLRISSWQNLQNWFFNNFNHSRCLFLGFKILDSRPYFFSFKDVIVSWDIMFHHSTSVWSCPVLLRVAMSHKLRWFWFVSGHCSIYHSRECVLLHEWQENPIKRGPSIIAIHCIMFTWTLFIIYIYIYIYMGIVQKVLDLSVVFDDLWYAKMTFGES